MAHATPIATAMNPVEAPASSDDHEPTASWRGRSLVLVGLMGSGKTTIGKRLAARLNWPFVDADAEIEAAAKMSIAEIFAKFGEAHFRDGERRVIRRLMQGRRKVIATGGGAFVDDSTRALMLAKGTVIWLDAEIETLVARVAKRNHRPLLVGHDPETVLRELTAIRNPLYAQAPIHVLSTNGPHDETVDSILARLETYQQEANS